MRHSSVDGSVAFFRRHLVLEANEVIGELFLELVVCLFLQNIWIILFSHHDVIDVVLLESLVLELPNSAVMFVEVLLVFFHVLLELNLPSWLEVYLVSNLIRNVSDVQKNDNHV